MTIRLKPPFAPMEALLVNAIPAGDHWQYEPKWDGFRCLAFRRAKKVYLQSKAGRPLTRYFPELVEALQKLSGRQFVLDGEIVIPIASGLSFDDLLQRIHPAESRIRKLSKETPALYIVFDLLEDQSGSLIKLPLAERRKRLEQFARAGLGTAPSIRLSPVTRDFKTARQWFSSAGTSLDGIVAKRTDVGYRSGDRSAMQKVKPVRTADCVVGGFRYGTNKKTVGSLLLGLYNEEGQLDHVGFTSGLKEAERKALTKKLEPLIQPPGFTGKAPGGPSRWSTKRSTQWQPLKPKLVVEVCFDHFTGGRFRHGTKLLRWRPDKSPRQCRLDQIGHLGAGSLKILKSTKRK